MHRAPPRLVGLILIAASGASNLAHRSVYEAAREGPAQTAEFALGLLTITLASVGILLLVHGGKLFERSMSGVSPEIPPADNAARHMQSMKAHGRVYDTRRGASLMQARHALQTSRRPASCDTPDAALPYGGDERSIPTFRR